MRITVLAASVLLAAMSAAGGCARTSPKPVTPAPAPSSTSAPSTPTSEPVQTVPPVRPAPPPAPSSTHPSRPTTRPAPAPGPQLPRGGRTLLPAYRIVAFYGLPGAPVLGVLGQSGPDQAAAAAERQAAAYAGYGRPVQPAMELITTVALGSPGPRGIYSSDGDPAQVARYLAVAKRHRLLLVLDFQPGRGEFLPQVQRFERFLLDPAVGVALDPEWKVGPGQTPGHGLIGSASAASVNAVSAYLSALTLRRHLPQKLFVVHQFTLPMLPDRNRIVARPGLATVFHADGFGTAAAKRTIYGQLHYPGGAFYAGFKLFYQHDIGLMSPAQAMQLRPRPDLITYQ